AVEAAPDLTLTGRADPALGIAVADVLDRADVLVDFTTPDTVVGNARAALAAGVHVVIGTTGFDPEELQGPSAGTEARSGSGRPRGNVFIAPNFAIGAVLMMRFAAEAAPHMARAEIIELHHDAKLDAPSGTAGPTPRPLAGATRGAAATIPPRRPPGPAP